MATSTVLSRKGMPPAVNPTDAMTKAQGDAGAGGYITLGETYRPMRGTWPPVDATNGPLTADAGLTNVAPSFTGMTLYPWNSGKFNVQSQNWVAVPASNGPATNQCCANVTTNLGTYGSTGIGYSSHTDFGFIADTVKVVVAYWVSNSAMPGVNTSQHEVQIFADDGQMKGIRSAPALWAGGSGGGNQLFYRVVSFSQAHRRRFRVWMSSNCWLAGVYVDSDADIKKAPNLPFCLDFGDSWEAPSGNVFSSVGGNGSIAGVTYPGSASLLYSNAGLQWALSTGWAVALCNQPATGWVVNNASGISATTNSPGFTSFLSISQWLYSFNLWGSHKPLVRVNGMWNDGDTPVSAPILTNYQAVVQAGFKRVTDSDSETPILVAGCQQKSITPGAGRDLCNSGIAAACAATPQVIGFINQINNWSGDIPAKNIGPDGLHKTMCGAEEVGDNYARQSAPFQILRTRLNQMTA